MAASLPTPERNYQRFLAEVRTSGEVWGLCAEEGWAVCDSMAYEETDVAVFWSDRAAAQQHAQGEWSGHVATAIPLAEFVEEWLAGMEEDGALVGPNWEVELGGLEVEPSEVAGELAPDDAA